MKVRDQLHAPGALTPEKKSCYPINRALVELQSGSERSEKENISCSSPNLNLGSSSP